MKRVFFLCLIVAAAMATSNNDAQAQTISAVSPGGITTTYNNLQTAVDSAQAGSILYLSGGVFGAATTTKQFTILGVGCRQNTQNTDGNTTIGGDFTFQSGGADNSAMMGVYLQGNINLLNVSNVLVRYCNVNAVGNGSYNTSSSYCTINQNIIRNSISGYYYGHNYVSITNNIIGDEINYITNGVIEHNIFLNLDGGRTMESINNSTIRNNVIKGSELPNCNNNTITDNIGNDSIGVNCTKLDWTNIFTGGTPPANAGALESFDFHLKSVHAGTDGSSIGIYGGTGWSETALPPVPYIISKRVSEQTDESGKLKVQVRVKAQ